MLFLCFGLGVFFAEAAFRKNWQKVLPWIAVASVLLLALHHTPEASVRFMLCCVCLGSVMAYLTNTPRHILRSVLEWKPLVTVGLFSYSIYLVHALFTEPTDYVMLPLHPSFTQIDDATHVLVMGSVALAAIGISYVFHRCFELPFMSHKRQEAEKRVSAPSEPADSIAAHA